MSRPAKKKQRRVVLSEEEYTSTLSQVVEREYFPDLPALRRQVAVLDRRAEGDIAGAVAIRRAARQLEQHEEALQEQEEYDEQNVDAATGTRKRPRPLHRETLSGFHARVTSEDNEEFEKTQAKEVKENRERLRQVFAKNNGLPALPPSTTAQGVGSETPLLASDKFNPSPHRIQASEWKDTEIGTNGMFFAPEHLGPAGGGFSVKRLTNGSAASDAATADNQLMPPPARVKRKQGETDVSAPDSALVVKQDMVEYTPKTSNAQEKRIEPSRTRFPPAHIVTLPTQPLVDSNDGDSSTDYSTEASTDLDEPAKPLSAERRSYLKRRRREQDTLVAMTPLIVPNDGNESPIVTWGTISSTPMVLGGLSFTMPSESTQDKAARNAQAKLEQAKQKANQAKRSKTPLLDRASSLTPAARSLLQKSMPRPTSSVRSRDAFSSALRSSYTPSVRRSSRSVQRDSASKATPRLPPASARRDKPDAKSETQTSGNITDDLLKLS